MQGCLTNQEPPATMGAGAEQTIKTETLVQEPPHGRAVWLSYHSILPSAYDQIPRWQNTNQVLFSFII